MRRGQLGALLGIVLVAVGALAATVLSGTRPLLGLDLQGGASVVLHPSDPSVKSDVLNQAIRIIRSRVDALGVAEPDITRQGKDVVIQLPGVKDKDRALSVVGQTARLRLRPVLGNAKADDPKLVAACDPGAHPNQPLPEDKPDQPATLPDCDKKAKTVSEALQLGPSLAEGDIISGARAEAPTNQPTWKVTFQLTSKGSKRFDEVAAICHGHQAQCPTGRLAIVLDGVVQSAPTIKTDNFGGSGEITGNFTQREAKDLALVLKYGSLPVELRPLTQQTVSASLGKGSLRAGIFAGAVGLAAVLVYMLVYYRALGLVVVLGLGVSGALLYSLLSYAGQHLGYALSLAGVTGVIVSVGVTVDSYVVYFERLKDEIRSGKTIRSSVDRGFARAWRTIIAADLTSLIGALILYLLTVGSVRGFALTLAVSTALDLLVAWTFTRPMVVLLGRNRLFTQARFFGVARGLAAAPTGGAA